MDPLDPNEFASLVTAITAAFGDRTRRDIYLLVHSHSSDPHSSDPMGDGAAADGPPAEAGAGLTTAEVAEHFKVHPNVARHHLEKLCAGGYLITTTTRSDGSAGRPAKRYATPAGSVTFNVPVRQDDLLARLLSATLDELEPERATTLAERVGFAYGTERARAIGADAQRSSRSALQVIADALSSHGFGARAEVEDNALRLVTDHCPFGDLRVTHPVLCALDRGMVMGMMEVLHAPTAVDLTTSDELGESHCVSMFRTA